jgi:hypothetical protein
MTQEKATNAPRGLAALPTVTLTPENQRLLDEARAAAGGTAMWKARKAAEARDLLALSQLAPRLLVQQLDLRESLRALLSLRVPVPCRLPGEDSMLVIGDQVLLGLTYPQEALRQQLPGYGFVQILAPLGVWHANVAYGPVQPLCLGAALPAGIRVKELVLMAYGALSLQTVQIDETDSAGVLNIEAARWWQLNVARIPLSRTPFLAPENEGKR